jgi:putative CocE/NonD family hydrolase
VAHIARNVHTTDPVRSRAQWIVWLVLLLVASGAARSARPVAQQDEVAQAAARFEAREAMIPMRDGVKLYTRIFVPKTRASDAPLPFMFLRTPYGIDHAEARFVVAEKELADEGYIFVFQDIRGRHKSEGAFVMQRPARDPADQKAIDEGSDTYDTIDWLLKNVQPNNGRVGMLGVSYDGWTTAMATLEPHPALRAVSPQASPADMWLGDDFHHNGAFRLSYGFEYAAEMESSKEQQPFAFDRYDTFQWYLELGPLSNVNAKYLHGNIPTWNDYVAHPDYDAFWKRQTLIPFIKDVKVATLSVAGWWDQEDFYGPIRIYDTLEKFDRAKHLSYLVVGPWNHGGWDARDGQKLGDIDFGSPTSRYFREQIQAPWFAYWLKDKGKLAAPEAMTFEAGTNQWRQWGAWPPREQTTEKNLYFRADGQLSFEAPAASQAADEFDSYVSDPAHPVPYRHRPIPPTYFPGGSGWTTWLVEDQRFVDDRSDVATWSTGPLDADTTIAGEVVAHLFASTSGSDSDWIVKLIDVYPEQMPSDRTLAGRQLMVSNEVFRGRYRNGFEKPEPLVPGQVTPFTFSLHTQNYTFLKGHRMMVQVQSTWFPLIDRNPQTFVPNIFEAKASDYVVATQRIYRSAKYPSHVAIPVVR